MYELNRADIGEEVRARGYLPHGVCWRKLDGTMIANLDASVMDEDRERCLASGMDDYVTKPVDIKTLSAIIEFWVLGQIWFAQIVVYPLLGRVGDEEYLTYHRFYARRIPLTLLGLLQYLTPTFQLLCGVVVLDEDLPPERLAGFVLVWVALILLGADAVRASRRRDELLPVAEAV